MSLKTTATLPHRDWVEQIMEMPISVHLRGENARSREAGRAVAAFFAELRAVDGMFSTQRAHSDVSRLNRGELDLDGCDPLVREVHALCVEAGRHTEGFFEPHLPGPDGALRFNPGGLLKGWAVERAAGLLSHLDDHDLCISAGGDVLVATAPGRPPWRVGVEDPEQPAQLVAALEVSIGAVATSGSAHRGGYVTDPRSGLPARQVRAVTVTGPSLLWADVYATAAVARGAGALAWLAGLPGYEALVIGADGTAAATRGLPLYLAGSVTADAIAA